MKKVLLGFVVLCTNFSFGQVLSEDFESVTTPALPNGWTATTQATNGYTGYYTGNETEANSAGYWPVAANGSSSFAMTNDDVQNEILCNELLISPSIDFTGLNNVQVSFIAYHDGLYGSGDATMEVSLDGGTTWTVIETLSPAASWESYALSLAAYDNESNVLLGFRWNDGGDCAGADNWGTGLAIDNVVVDEAPPFDVSMDDNSVREYTIVPLDQLQGAIGATGIVTNTGSQTVTNVSMLSNVYDTDLNLVYSQSSNVSPTLAPGATVNTTVPGFSPIADGVYTVELISNIGELDANPANDTVSYTLVVTNTYARDNGSVDVSLGVGAGSTATLGNSYEIISTTTLSSVSFFMIPGTDGLGDTVSVSVYDMATGLPNTLIAQSLDYIITEADTTSGGAFLTLPILSGQGTALELAPGFYYVGVNEYNTVDNMALGQSLGIETPNTCFGSINGGVFQAMESFNFPGPFIVRPNFACNVTTDNVTACDTYTWATNGETYTATGAYTELLTDVSGCDSLITLDLTITGPSFGTDVQSSCGPYTWIDGETYTESNNSAIYTLVDVNGCDSIVTLNLTINAPSNSIDTQVACGPYEWIDGEVYTASNNTATYTLINSVGCDSIVTLDLSIVSLIETTDVQEACGSFTWIDGNTYTENTSATFMLTSINGCDSLVTLDLTITSVLQTIDSYEECGSFTWTDGITYTESNNTATQTLISVGGCDSIVTLDLIINPLPSNVVFVSGATITADAFASSYQWFDCLTGLEIEGATFQSFTATESGDYGVLININGCVNESECEYIDVSSSGLSESQSEFSLEIYPNPSSGIFTISLSDLSHSQVSITILDLSGKIITQEKYQLNTTEFEIPMDVSNVESGVYFIKIDAGKIITQRVVLTKK